MVAETLDFTREVVPRKSQHPHQRFVGRGTRKQLSNDIKHVQHVIVEGCVTSYAELHSHFRIEYDDQMWAELDLREWLDALIMSKPFGDPKTQWDTTRAELHARLQERTLVAVTVDKIIHIRIPAFYGETTEPSASWASFLYPACGACSPTYMAGGCSSCFITRASA